MPLPEVSKRALLSQISATRADLNFILTCAKAAVAQHAAEAHLLDERGHHADARELEAAEPQRWISIARTHLQQGLMALERAVDMPHHF